LPLFIRALNVRADGVAEREERAARIATAQAAIGALMQQMPRLTEPEQTRFAQSLLDQYQRRLQRHSANAEPRNHLDAQHESQRQIWLEAVNAERAQLMQLHDENVINDEVLRVLQGDLDLEESLISSAARQTR